ncbi:MAG: hypothetical protein GF347_04270 [Candidatus Moranbacteria bacterium]|nr:hypothetical protein [Candidatus Moranbacteria bacterium]
MAISGKDTQDINASDVEITPAGKGGDVLAGNPGSSSIESVDLSKKDIPMKLLKLFAKEMVERYKMIPFGLENGELKVAMVNPGDMDAVNAMRFLASKSNYRTEIFKTSEESFKKALENYEASGADIQDLVKDYIKSEEQLKAEREARKKKKREQEDVSAAPVAKVVDVILDHAIKGRASDIHIEPQEDVLRVRYRVDGALHESFKMAKGIAPAVVSRVKIMSNLRIDEKRKPQDGRLKAEAEDGREIDVRVSTLPTAEGEKVVMRLLEKNENLTQLSNLGMYGRNIEVLKEALDQPYGIILVTGPTGSGKSTTIFASLKKLNEIKRNILTLEDPVEYKVDGVNHCQVKPEIGFTFASGLRSALRQDPDIIMVGEIRDGETAELATHAALTGHLVLSTLHTNDALGAIPRLVDMGIEPFLVSSSLRAVVGQRLVRRICDSCKHKVEPTDRVKRYVLETLEGISEKELKKRIPDFDPTDFKVWKAKGCAKCRNSGYKGRIGIFEVVFCGPQMRTVIDDDLSAGNLKEEFRRQGAVFMHEDGILKALNGHTTIEAIEEATAEDNQEELNENVVTLQEKKKEKQDQLAQAELESQKASAEAPVNLPVS